jgi:nucleoside 2-deoxyribosyltransferase
MKLVYIAGPFRAASDYIPGEQDDFAVKENVMRAMKLGLEVARTPGLFPIIPHANTIFFQGSAPDHVWLEGDLELLKRSDGVLMTPDWTRSRGATAERFFAIEHGIPVFLTIEEMKKHFETVIAVAARQRAA